MFVYVYAGIWADVLDSVGMMCDSSENNFEIDMFSCGV